MRLKLFIYFASGTPIIPASFAEKVTFSVELSLYISQLTISVGLLLDSILLHGFMFLCFHQCHTILRFRVYLKFE